jgi:hypothetical protein
VAAIQVEVLLSAIKRSNADMIRFMVHICNLPGLVRVLHTPAIKLDDICSNEASEDEDNSSSSSILCIDCGNEVRVIIPWFMLKNRLKNRHRKRSLVARIATSPLFLCALCYAFPQAAALVITAIHLMGKGRIVGIIMWMCLCLLYICPLAPQ